MEKPKQSQACQRLLSRHGISLSNRNREIIAEHVSEKLLNIFLSRTPLRKPIDSVNLLVLQPEKSIKQKENFLHMINASYLLLLRVRRLLGTNLLKIILW